VCKELFSPSIASSAKASPMEFNPLSAKLDEAKAYNGKQRIVSQSFCVLNQTPQQFAPSMQLLNTTY
jgi:hypothetical protein